MSSDKIYNNTTYRIAVASNDGYMIDKHFGKTNAFLIFDIDCNGWKFSEKRTVTPLCNNCGDEDEGYSSILNTLSDCTAVIAARIGMKTRRSFEMNSITVFEQADYIDNALEKLSSYYTKSRSSNLVKT